MAPRIIKEKSPEKLTQELKQTRDRIKDLEMFLANRKGVEDEFSISWDMYRSIFETTGAATIIIEENLFISLVNMEFEKLCGYSCDEIEGKKSLLDFIANKDDITTVQDFHRVRLIEPKVAPRNYELQFRDKYGNIKDVYVTIDLIPGTKKTVASFLDITQRKEAEHKLQQAEEKYRTIFDHSAAAITVTDEKERIISWNRFAEGLLGMDKKSFYLRPVRSLYPPQEWKRIRAHNVRSKGIQDHLETKIIKKNNEIIDVDISITVLKDKKGKITGSIGIIRDITARKKAERCLKQSQKALMQANLKLQAEEKQLEQALSQMREANEQLRKTQDVLIQSEKIILIGQLSVGIAHEIRNPLTVILQGTEVVERILAGSGNKGKVYIEMIRKAAERANRVVIELLNFSRPSHVEPRPVILHAIIDRAISLLRHATKMEQVNITCNYSPQVEYIHADNLLLEEAFLNLLKNAVEAESKNVRIITRLVKSKKHDVDRATIEVIDDGRGIPGENLEHIFQPFFTTKEAGEGTGLGLPMVSLILQRHNGTIGVESKLEKGTKFTITLPLRIAKVKREGK